MSAETIYDVHWEGPYRWEDKEKHLKSHHVLYQIYGLHHCYGRNVLLYIGRTERGGMRLTEHEWWAEYEYDPLEVRFGSVGEFTSWEKWDQNHKYRKASPDLTKEIEALLIYANQPAYNSSNKGSVRTSKGLRVFNTGKSGQLLPEVSCLYYCED